MLKKQTLSLFFSLLLSSSLACHANAATQPETKELMRNNKRL
jgi:hypothetical protein